jgi:allophanate hydrolase
MACQAILFTQPTSRAFYHLEHLRAQRRPVWDRSDCFVVPTTPTIYCIEEVLAEPRRLNAQLGMYTHFANLLDLAAMALPSGFRPSGMPTSLTLIAPAFQDDWLVDLAMAFQRRIGLRLGATNHFAFPPPHGMSRHYLSI